LFFKNGNLSHEFRYVDEIWFDLLKAAISTNAKPEIFSVRGRHLDKAILCHISAVADPE